MNKGQDFRDRLEDLEKSVAMSDNMHATWDAQISSLSALTQALVMTHPKPEALGALYGDFMQRTLDGIQRNERGFPRFFIAEQEKAVRAVMAGWTEVIAGLSGKGTQMQ